jgi:enoyl-CoA hydratase/carnithine racemase
VSSTGKRTARSAESRGVQVSVANGVAWVTLDRGRSGNRIDETVARRLCDAAEQIEFDDDVALVVLAGQGNAFCAGAADRGSWEGHHDCVAAIGALTRPVLAVVNGDAVAEGCELALACDLRIAVSGARFSLPQISEGRLPCHGATQRLPRIIGRMRAMEMLLTGRLMTAREALDIGLVSRVAARPQLATVIENEVESLRGKGAVALRLAKDAVVKGLDLTLEQGIRLEQDLYVLLQTTADRQEGIRAFLEKRKPRFRGA